jgi:hypothetical protein
VAVDGATDAAWPLAQRVYQSAVLRPAGIDDARARVLAGEPPPALSPVEITELSELRRGVKGDDAASREVLAALVEKLDVHAIIVVSVAEHQTSARVYDSDLRAFDAARYLPDAPRFDTWHDAIRALERPYLRQPTSLVAPEVDRPKARRESRPFYDSPWFWVAVGAAAVLVGGGVILATTLQTNDTIHLTAQLP